MALIPTKRELGPLEQLAARPQFTPARSFEGAALEGLGQTLQGVGSAFAGMAKEDAEAAERVRREKEQTEAFAWDQQSKQFEQGLLNDVPLIQQTAPASGLGLTQTGMQEFDRRSQDLLKAAPPQLQEKAKALIDTSRVRFSGVFAEAEQGQRKGWYLGTLADSAKGAENAVFDDPSKAQDAITNFNAEVDASGLSDAEKEDLKRKGRETFIMAKAARETRTARDVPETAADAHVRLGVESRPASGSGGRSRAAGLIQRGRGIADYYVKKGLSPVAAAGIAGALLQENSGHFGGKPGDGGISHGAAQWNGARFAGLKSFAAARGTDWTDGPTQLDYILHEMDSGDAGAQRAGRELRAAKTPEEAAEAMMHFERPQGYSSGNPRNGHGFSNRLSYARQVLGQQEGTGAIDSGSPGESDAASQSPNDILANMDPLYRDLPLDQRLKIYDGMVQEAERGATARNIAARALAGQTVDDFNLRIATGDTTLTTQDILGNTNIDNGQRATLINSLAAKRKDQEDTNALVHEITMGNEPLNPLDPDTQKAADKAYTAMVTDQPDQAEVIGDVMVRRGVIPKAIGNSLRNGLYSTDPATVAATLNRASQIRSRAPAAFDNIPDAADLRKDTASFEHFVTDRGMSPDDAARTLLLRRSPEWKVNEQVQGPIADKAIKDLTLLDAVNAVGASGMFSSPGDGSIRDADGNVVDATAPNQLRSEFGEAVRDEMIANGGDLEEAKKRAAVEIQKTWGVSNVTGSPQVMKYAPEKFYPPAAGGHDYLRDDALATAKEQAGGEVGGIALRADPATAADVKAGRPPRYRLFFLHGAEAVPIIDEALQYWGLTPDRIKATVQTARDAALQGAEEKRAAKKANIDQRTAAKQTAEKARADLLGPDGMKVFERSLVDQGQNPEVPQPQAPPAAPVISDRLAPAFDQGALIDLGPASLRTRLNEQRDSLIKRAPRFNPNNRGGS